VSLFPLFFFKFLVFEVAIYANKDVYIRRVNGRRGAEERQRIAFVCQRPEDRRVVSVWSRGSVAARARGPRRRRLSARRRDGIAGSR